MLIIAYISPAKAYVALGLEGSANKLGAGVIKHNIDGSMQVLSNVRHTYITPPGEGFLPRDTAQHHREWALTVIKDAVVKANITIHDLDCICYTKGRLHPLGSVLVKTSSRSWYGCSLAVCCSGRSHTLIAI